MKLAPPSDMEQISLVFRHEILRFIRSWRLPAAMVIVFVIALLILVIPPALGSDYPSGPDAFFRTFAQFSGILVVISATLFGADAIVSEFQQRTGYIIFPTPTRREVIFAGKFLGSFAACMVVLATHYGVGAAAGLAITGSTSYRIGLSFILAAFYMWGILAVAYLISSLMKGSTGSNILVFFLFFMIFPIVSGVASVAGVEPTPVPTYAGGVVSDVLEDPYPVDVGQDVPIGPNNTTMTVWEFHTTPGEASLVISAYGIPSSVLALVVFRRREM